MYTNKFYTNYDVSVHPKVVLPVCFLLCVVRNLRKETFATLAHEYVLRLLQQGI